MTSRKLISVEEFKTVLSNNRDIKLIHGRVRYKARDVTEVLFSERGIFEQIYFNRDGSCSRYVVKTDDVIFYVWKWLPYSRDGDANTETLIQSFDTINELKEYLNSTVLNHISDYLFPQTLIENEGSDTDSY